MDAAAVFARCAERRRAVADLIETLDADQLATPSLCAGWDVKTVAAHLTVPLVVSPLHVGAMVIRHRGSFAAANVDLAHEAARVPVERIAASLREHSTSRFTPPLHGPGAPLTDLVVHTADIRVPLGLPPDVPGSDAEIVLDFITGFTMFFVPRGLLRGVRLAPTDLDRSWGTGAVVHGAATDIVLAIFRGGRFLDAVSGPGKDVLARRA